MLIYGVFMVDAIVNPYKKYSYEDLQKDSASLFLRYPGLITTSAIGYSAEGRRIILITLGKGANKILLLGAHHAREYITSGFLMKMAEEYAGYYEDNIKAGGFDVVSLLDNITMHVVPMVNPDGVYICQNGLSENMRGKTGFSGDFRVWKANSNGVDLNRQYPCLWEELDNGVYAPAAEGFKGAAPASEREAQAVISLCMENKYLLSASFHTKGGEIIYKDSLTGNKLPQARGIAKRLSRLTGYRLKSVTKDKNKYAGGFENYFRLRFSRCAFLIELTPYNNTDIPHDDTGFDSLIWCRARFAGLMLADEALKL